MSKSKAPTTKDAFLADNDDDIPDENGTIKLTAGGEKEPESEIHSRVERSPLSPATQKLIHTYEKIYKVPCHKGCTNHLFCHREKMAEMISLQEKYPIMPNDFVFPSNHMGENVKNAKQAMYTSYLKEPFQFRDIQLKK